MAETKEKKPAKEKKVTSGEIPVFDVEGTQVSTMKVPAGVINADENIKLIAQYERVYQANQRKGMASAKTRGQVSGSTKKIYKQKGTGNARHGSRKAPIFVGGGIVFGPIPHDYSLQLNKKQVQKALAAALHIKYTDKKLAAMVKESIDMKKTKDVALFLKNTGMTRKTLLVLPEKAEGFMMSARNIPSLMLRSVSTLNAHDVLEAHSVFFIDETLSIVGKRLA